MNCDLDDDGIVGVSDFFGVLRPSADGSSSKIDRFVFGVERTF